MGARLTGPGGVAGTREVAACWLAAAAVAALYLLGAALRLAGPAAHDGVQPLFFGISKMAVLAREPLLAAALIALAAALYFTPGPEAALDPGGRAGTVKVLALALLAVGVFFALRSNFVNTDGLALAQKFAHDVPRRGAHVTHDEMWELFVHSRFWEYTHDLLGWSVKRSYQVLSSLAGGVFVLLALAYCRVLSPRLPGRLFLLAVAAGYMQLFFGDVENYTLTVALITGYLLASAQFLEGRVSVVLPSFLLAVALTFHLLAGFLLPSLLYLYLVAWGRGQRRGTVAAALLFGAVVAATLAYFHFAGLPIRRLWYHSHAFGHGGNIGRMLAVPKLPFILRKASLLTLLAPSWLLLVPLALFRRIALDPLNVHLIFSVAGMGLLVFGWRSQIGIYQDWNLFAAAAIPVTFLAWRNVLAVPALGRHRAVSLLGALFFVHSYAWVVGNHLL